MQMGPENRDFPGLNLLPCLLRSFVWSESPAWGDSEH